MTYPPPGGHTSDPYEAYGRPRRATTAATHAPGQPHVQQGFYPPPRRNRTPWIIGALLGMVAVVSVAIAAVALSGANDSSADELPTRDAAAAIERIVAAAGEPEGSGDTAKIANCPFGDMTDIVDTAGVGDYLRGPRKSGANAVVKNTPQVVCDVNFIQFSIAAASSSSISRDAPDNSEWTSRGYVLSTTHGGQMQFGATADGCTAGWSSDDGALVVYTHIRNDDAAITNGDVCADALKAVLTDVVTNLAHS